MERTTKRRPAPVAVGIVQQKIFGIPVDRNVLFSNHKKVYKRSVEKRQRKLFLKMSFLKPFLDIDEKVLLVTTGHSPPTFFEKMLIGWFFIYLKRSLLVFTNKRLFHVPTTPAYTYRNRLSEIPYGVCRSIQLKGGALVVEYRGAGIFERFVSIAGKERKKIAALIKSLRFGGGDSTTAHRIPLCPRCSERLAAKVQPCSRCGLKFKHRVIAALSAVLLPGGGYFYTRQYFLGVMVAILEGAVLANLYIAVQKFLAGNHTGLYWMISLFAFIAVEKITVAIHAWVLAQEHIPRKKNVTFQTVARPAG